MNNSESFKRVYKSSHFIEWLIISGLFLGIFSKIVPIKIVHYLLCIFTQIALVIRGLRWKCSRRGIVLYFRTIVLILLMAAVFVFMRTDFVTGLNRICPLLAIYGFVIVGTDNLKIDIEYIIKKIVVLYIVLATIINIDAASHLILAKSLWPPILYLGARFVGPTGDPNFLAMWSSGVLIIVLYSDVIKKKSKWFAVTMLLINILIARSLSTFILLPISMLAGHFLKGIRLRRVQFCILVPYFLGMFLYGEFRDKIRNIGIELLKIVLQSSYKAEVKYTSLAIRFDTQWEALRIFVDEWWGQGPRQIVPQLGRDTHNSYVAILFELGIIGFILIISTLQNRLIKNKMIVVYSLYIMLSALLLDVHYLALYSLLLIIQFRNPNVEKRDVYLKD